MNHIQTPNHLASQLDHITSAKLKLPKSLMARYTEQKRLTQLVRNNLTQLISDEILSNCLVVDFDRISITLSVSNQTAANHLAYLSEYVVAQLVGTDDAFAHLKMLRVIVNA